jgi:hypothetical protein
MTTDDYFNWPELEDILIKGFGIPVRNKLTSNNTKDRVKDYCSLVEQGKES